jgi:hypothetical protein
MDAFDASCFCIDVRFIAAQQTGSRAHEGSAIVVEVPVHVDTWSPEVTDTIDAFIGGLKKNQGDGVGETDKIAVNGLFIDGEEERLGCCKG